MEQELVLKKLDFGMLSGNLATNDYRFLLAILIYYQDINFCILVAEL